GGSRRSGPGGRSPRLGGASYVVASQVLLPQREPSGADRGCLHQKHLLRRGRAASVSNDPNTPGAADDDGLPEELARIFRDLNGGRDLPPQVIQQLKAMGIADADPAQVASMTSQIKAMFTPGAQTKGVDVAAATTAARERLTEELTATTGER